MNIQGFKSIADALNPTSDSEGRPLNLVPTFRGGIMTGDVDDGDVDDGDIEISGDIDVAVGDTDGGSDGDIVGAIKRMRKRARRTQNISLKVNPSASAPAVRMAQTVAKTAQDVYMSMPGAAFNATMMPPVIQSNAKSVAPGTTQKIQGWILRHNIERMLSICTWPTEIVSGSVAAGANSITLTFGTSSSTPKRYLIPVFFLTVTGSILQSQSGSRITIAWTAKDEFGQPVNSDPWSYERVNLNTAMSFSIVPFFRVKDTIKPVLVSLFSTTANVNSAGAVDTTAIVASIIVTITGLVPGESAQLVIPGLDSNELKNFCAAWGLKF